VRSALRQDDREITKGEADEANAIMTAPDVNTSGSGSIFGYGPAGYRKDTPAAAGRPQAASEGLAL
jgi:hypothetical protein